jgi:hypothetical protein
MSVRDNGLHLESSRVGIWLIDVIGGVGTHMVSGTRLFPRRLTKILPGPQMPNAPLVNTPNALFEMLYHRRLSIATPVIWSQLEKYLESPGQNRS